MLAIAYFDDEDIEEGENKQEDEWKDFLNLNL